MKHLVIIEAIEMAQLTKDGIQEAQEQLTLCSQELDQPLPYDESEEIIEQMMELELMKDACKTSLEVINKFIKENKYLFN
jgi:hypothetical protein